MNEIIELAMRDGIWAVLFCLLFLYELKDSRRREHKYQDTVAKLTESLELIHETLDTCHDIKNDTKQLDKISNDCQALLASHVGVEIEPRQRTRRVIYHARRGIIKCDSEKSDEIKS